MDALSMVALGVAASAGGGGGGTTYTAGDNIDITNDEISVTDEINLKDVEHGQEEGHDQYYDSKLSGGTIEFSYSREDDENQRRNSDFNSGGFSITSEEYWPAQWDGDVWNTSETFHSSDWFSLTKRTIKENEEEDEETHIITRTHTEEENKNESSYNRASVEKRSRKEIETEEPGEPPETHVNESEAAAELTPEHLVFRYEEKEDDVTTVSSEVELTTSQDTLLVNGSAVALKSGIPTATSDLLNDSGFITLNDVPEELPTIASGDAGKVLTVNAEETGVEWAAGGGGGGSYTFTNGLTESSGTVSWDLNDEIKKKQTNASRSKIISIGTGPANTAGKSGTSGTDVSIAIGGLSTESSGSSSSGRGSIAMGYDHIYSTGTGSLAGGYGQSAINGITASGSGSIAYGWANSQNGMVASGDASVVFGKHFNNYSAKASGISSAIIGYSATTGSLNSETMRALGTASFAQGNSTCADSNYQHAAGKFNVADASDVYAYIIGNGTDASNRANAFTVDWSGNVVAAGTVTPTGADYCEYFEFEDGNPDNEDRMGLLVTLHNGKIVLANEEDDLLGITTGTKGVIGDAEEMNWVGKYVKDELGRLVYEDYDVVHEEGTESEWTEHVHTKKISEDYDPSQEYIPRSKRKEWYPVGLLGKIYVKDDGTSQVNGYVKANNGIATHSESKTNMRVLERVNDHIIRVILK